ncbi:MAG TPA: V-type ATP synthase subunit D [Sedimentisphaerales bacterium]|nr:V-type ATP synthase subunit D [Sedimentisphaerales bacterium]
MAKRKIKFTRTELKQQRDALSRFSRYLPTLKLKQQQVQLSILQTRQLFREKQGAVKETERTISAYDGLFNDVAGVNVTQLSTPDSVNTSTHSIAGVHVPRFETITFPKDDFSLFATAPWVDRALADLKQLNRQKAELRVLQECLDLLQAELKKVMQRVNLFEKVMIPNTMDNIRRIRIALGDQMTAGVARAKIAKAKLEQKEHESSMEAAAL